MTAIINSVNSLTSDQCEAKDDSTYPVYFMIMDDSTDGFIGKGNELFHCNKTNFNTVYSPALLSRFF